MVVRTVRAGSWLPAALPALLGVAFFLLYLVCGLALARTGAFAKYDVLFQVDTPRVIDNMTEFRSDRFRVSTHPLYPMLVNPAGCALKAMFGSGMKAALVLNAALGAGGVVLAFIFFRVLCGKLPEAMLLAGLFGLSASQFFLSVIPDTTSLTVCALIGLYLLLLVDLRRRELHQGAWLAAGIVVLGTNILNIAQVLICFSVLAWSLPGSCTGRVKRLMTYLAIVLSSVAALALFQSAVFHAGLPFVPGSYRQNLEFVMSRWMLERPLTVVGEIVRHVFLVNFIAPLPETFQMSVRQNPAVTFIGVWRYHAVGGAALALWGVSWGIRVLGKARGRAGEPGALYRALLLCLLFNMVFHCFYGFQNGRIEYFFFTGNFTFLVLALLGRGITDGKMPGRLLLGGLALLTGANNLAVLRDLLGIYGRG